MFEDKILKKNSCGCKFSLFPIGKIIWILSLQSKLVTLRQARKHRTQVPFAKMASYQGVFFLTISFQTTQQRSCPRPNNFGLLRLLCCLWRYCCVAQSLGFLLCLQRCSTFLHHKKDTFLSISKASKNLERLGVAIEKNNNHHQQKQTSADSEMHRTKHRRVTAIWSSLV